MDRDKGETQNQSKGKGKELVKGDFPGLSSIAAHYNIFYGKNIRGDRFAEGGVLIHDVHPSGVGVHVAPTTNMIDPDWKTATKMEKEAFPGLISLSTMAITMDQGKVSDILVLTQRNATVRQNDGPLFTKIQTAIRTIRKTDKEFNILSQDFPQEGTVSFNIQEDPDKESRCLLGRKLSNGTQDKNPFCLDITDNNRIMRAVAGRLHDSRAAYSYTLSKSADERVIVTPNYPGSELVSKYEIPKAEDPSLYQSASEYDVMRLDITPAGKNESPQAKALAHRYHIEPPSREVLDSHLRLMHNSDVQPLLDEISSLRGRLDKDNPAFPPRPSYDEMVKILRDIQGINAPPVEMRDDLSASSSPSPTGRPSSPCPEVEEEDLYTASPRIGVQSSKEGVPQDLPQLSPDEISLESRPSTDPPEKSSTQAHTGTVAGSDQGSPARDEESRERASTPLPISSQTPAIPENLGDTQPSQPAKKSVELPATSTTGTLRKGHGPMRRPTSGELEKASTSARDDGAPGKAKGLKLKRVKAAVKDSKWNPFGKKKDDRGR
jgi:hypothetical protein